MDRALQTEIVTQLFAHMAHNTTDLAPEEMYLDTASYIDPTTARREHEAIFRRLPLIAAHATELPNPNDFITCELTGVPVLVVRQPDGSIKAFTNVCRHRGARVEQAERGNRKLFVCPFHAWSFDCTGSLRAMPFAQGFAGMDVKQRGLIPLPVEERHGLVWVVTTPGASIDVAAHLGTELDAELAGWKLGSYVFERMQRFDVPTNWKLLMDGFMEDYHLPILHKATVGPYFAPNLHTFKAYGPHSRLVPGRANITKLRHLPPQQVDLLRCSAMVYMLFPGSVLVWQNDHFELWTILPHASEPGRATAAARLLAPSAEAARTQKELWDRNWKILMDTVEKEDWVASKDIQDAISGGGQRQFVFGRNEPALQHFHRQIANACAAQPVAHAAE